MAKRRTKFIVVNSPDEIPDFANEDEEHEFWQTHSLGPGMLAGMKPVSAFPELAARLPPPRPRAVSLRLDGDTVRRLRLLATRKGMPYQKLLQDFVVERLYEEEKREGLVGQGTVTGRYEAER